MAVRDPDQRSWSYEDFRFFAATLITKEAEDQYGSKITWADLALDYALSLEATARGMEPDRLKITAKEAALAVRKYCGEKAYQNLPELAEIRSMIKGKKLLRLAFGY